MVVIHAYTTLLKPSEIIDFRGSLRLLKFPNNSLKKMDNVL